MSTSNRRANWGRNTLHIFCDICCKAVEKGMRPGTHLNKNGWKHVVQEFEKQCGFKYERLQLKNKWTSLRDKWRRWKELKGKETGLEFDYRRNTILVEDTWWIDKIKINPKFAEFKVTGVEPELEHKLDIMFGDTIAAKELALSPSSNMLPILCRGDVNVVDEEMGVEGCGDSEEEAPLDERLNEIQHASRTENEELGGHNDEGNVQRRQKRNDSSGSRSRVGKQSKRGRRESSGAAMISRYIQESESMDQSGDSVSFRNCDPPGCSIYEVMKDVQTLPGIDLCSDFYMFCTELLEQRTKREMYVTNKTASMKLRWLQYCYKKQKQ